MNLTSLYSILCSCLREDYIRGIASCKSGCRRGLLQQVARFDLLQLKQFFVINKCESRTLPQYHIILFNGPPKQGLLQNTFGYVESTTALS